MARLTDEELDRMERFCGHDYDGGRVPRAVVHKEGK